MCMEKKNRKSTKQRNKATKVKDRHTNTHKRTMDVTALCMKNISLDLTLHFGT